MSCPQALILYFLLVKVTQLHTLRWLSLEMAQIKRCNTKAVRFSGHYLLIYLIHKQWHDFSCS